jgi:toxin FitB
MIVLDTNIVSELYKPKPHQSVITWLDLQPNEQLYLCTPVLAELRFGAERLDAGRRKDFLSTAIDRLENELYRDRILDFDRASAAAYGRIAAARRYAGKTMQQMDCFIAAIASANGAALATRNISHFSGLGFELINPFEAAADR